LVLNMTYNEESITLAIEIHQCTRKEAVSQGYAQSVYSALQQTRKQAEAQAYRQKRASSYPPIGDQLDALFHAGVFPEEMANKIQAVKDLYPKPE